MTKTWFLSGCSTGFGKLMAQALLDQGHQVAATARRVEALDELKPMSADQLLRQTLDVTQAAQINAAVDAAVKRFGHVDVLVNNAGYGYFSIQEYGDIDEIRRLFETNVFGLIRLTQAVLPGMRRRKSGTIINVSSIAGRVAFPRSGFYNASKWAVEALSESLLYEVQPSGIRVVVIEPGAYDTDFGPRSAVRSASLTDPDSPYAHLANVWSDAAAEMMPRKQDPMEVVEGMIAAGMEGPAFLRLPFGDDANALVAERESKPDAEFIDAMTRRYYP